MPDLSKAPACLLRREDCVHDCPLGLTGGELTGCYGEKLGTDSSNAICGSCFLSLLTDSNIGNDSKHSYINLFLAFFHSLDQKPSREALQMGKCSHLPLDDVADSIRSQFRGSSLLLSVLDEALSGSLGTAQVGRLVAWASAQEEEGESYGWGGDGGSDFEEKMGIENPFGFKGPKRGSPKIYSGNKALQRNENESINEKNEINTLKNICTINQQTDETEESIICVRMVRSKIIAALTDACTQHTHTNSNPESKNAVQLAALLAKISPTYLNSFRQDSDLVSLVVKYLSRGLGNIFEKSDFFEESYFFEKNNFFGKDVLEKEEIVCFLHAALFLIESFWGFSLFRPQMGRIKRETVGICLILAGVTHNEALRSNALRISHTLMFPPGNISVSLEEEYLENMLLKLLRPHMEQGHKYSLKNYRQILNMIQKFASLSHSLTLLRQTHIHQWILSHICEGVWPEALEQQLEILQILHESRPSHRFLAYEQMTEFALEALRDNAQGRTAEACLKAMLFFAERGVTVKQEKLGYLMEAMIGSKDSTEMRIAETAEKMTYFLENRSPLISANATRLIALLSLSFTEEGGGSSSYLFKAAVVVYSFIDEFNDPKNRKTIVTFAKCLTHLAKSLSQRRDNGLEVLVLLITLRFAQVADGYIWGGTKSIAEIDEAFFFFLKMSASPSILLFIRSSSPNYALE